MCLLLICICQGLTKGTVNGHKNTDEGGERLQGLIDFLFCSTTGLVEVLQ